MRPAGEDGFLMATAMILLLIMMTIGLAVVAFSDDQQRASGFERTRESSFTLGEAALQNQVFAIGAAWPGTSARAIPACTSATAAGQTTCPDAGNLSAAYTGPDYTTASCPAGTPTVPWSTSVRDNGVLSPTATSDVSYYSAALVDSRPAWDANGDGKLWVRSQSVARCRVQTQVALVQQNLIPQAFPRRVVTANWFQTTNKGNKVIIDTIGTRSAQAVDVSVRCQSPGRTPCADYQSTKGQIKPDTTKIDATTSPTVSDTQLASFKAQALTNGLYFAGCPGNALVGVNSKNAVAYVEDAGVGCALGGGFTDAFPGVLVVNRGTIVLGGNSIFYGLLYCANKGALSSAVVTISGTAGVQGAVAIDGPGGLVAGSSKANIVYDDRALELVKGYAGAGIVQNSWRQLPNGQ